MGVCVWVGGMPPQELKSIKFFLSRQERKRMENGLHRARSPRQEARGPYTLSHPHSHKDTSM